MITRRTAFTLIELLVVLAILVVLAGLLFPVFSSARESAKKATCIVNMRQIGYATQLYQGDYDDYFIPVNHQPAEPPNSRNDRTWVQLVLPYVRSFAVFRCPSDFGIRPTPETTFDQDLVPGDVYSMYYTASLRANTGYNFLYLSPIIWRNGQWTAEPKQGSNVAEPSKTLMYVDSVWDRTANGTPYGGGNWLITPPCRYTSDGGRRYDTFAGTTGNVSVYSPHQGWNTNPKSANAYGNAWPWHSGRLNIVRVDGSVYSAPPAKLAEGCQVRDNWAGFIGDSGKYPWDLR